MTTELLNADQCRAWCVAWDFDSQSHLIALFEDLKNHNANKALDRQNGMSVIRTDLSMGDAAQIARALNGITGDLT